MQVDSNFLKVHAEYTKWATRTVVDACRPLSQEELERDLGNSHGSIFGTLQHTFVGDWVWLRRLEGVVQPMPSDVPPSKTIDELWALWNPVLASIIAHAASDDPNKLIKARRTNGEPIELTVMQIIVHVVNHATWHRGQVITMLRQLGHGGVANDISLYYRERAAASAGH